MPTCSSTAHAAASGPAVLADCIVGLSTGYPGQPAYANHASRRSARSRNSSTEAPLGAYAYLCRSTDSEVTPGTDRSNGGASGRKGSTHPPMQASTWHSTPRSAAAAAMSATGSTVPVGYDGADATTSAVRSVIALATAPGSARKSRSTGVVTTERSR